MDVRVSQLDISCYILGSVSTLILSLSRKHITFYFVFGLCDRGSGEIEMAMRRGAASAIRALASQRYSASSSITTRLFHVRVFSFMSSF